MQARSGSARAWIEPDGIRIDLTPGRDELTESTRFEIGSIVKTMTATLLATYVVDGTVALDDPVGRWIDAGPCADVTIGELATHTSGLPRVPRRLRWSRRLRLENPYAHLGADDLIASMHRARLRDRGHFAYSNFGFMVLGHVLSLIGGDGFEELLTERVLRPARVDVSFHGDEGVIPGYANERPVAHWDHPLGGHGGVRASVAALAGWVTANLDPPEQLREAMLLSQQQREGLNTALGWMVGALDPAVRWHNGGTGGFSSFCGFNPERRVGVVTLANSKNATATLDATGLAELSAGS